MLGPERTARQLAEESCEQFLYGFFLDEPYQCVHSSSFNIPDAQTRPYSTSQEIATLNNYSKVVLGGWVGGGGRFTVFADTHMACCCIILC